MHRRIITNNKIQIALKTAFGCLLLVLTFGGTSFAQYTGNVVRKEKLVTTLRSKQLQTREIVNTINARGVDFKLTSDIEKELTAAGARPEVISAVRDNYRQPERASNPDPAPAKTTASTKKISGEPLAKDAIVTLLENGVADAQVRKNVEARGVSFKPNQQINKEIREAGGSVALVNLIAGSYIDPNPNSGANSGAASNTTTTTGAAGKKSSGSDDYEALVDKAVAQYDVSKDAAGAITSLLQAVKLDPNNARGYQLLGFTYLYGQQNFVEAEKNMREAINRGGSAVFRVFHDHDGLFTESCQGSLFVAKDVVRFESDDNVHTFQTDDVNIKEVKTNSAFRRAFQTKTGSFKIVLKTGDVKDSIKFGFAPLTDNIAESKMIIRLIGKNN